MIIICRKRGHDNDTSVVLSCCFLSSTAVWKRDTNPSPNLKASKESEQVYPRVHLSLNITSCIYVYYSRLIFHSIHTLYTLEIKPNHRYTLFLIIYYPYNYKMHEFLIIFNITKNKVENLVKICRNKKNSTNILLFDMLLKKIVL